MTIKRKKKVNPSSWKNNSHNVELKSETLNLETSKQKDSPSQRDCYSMVQPLSFRTEIQTMTEQLQKALDYCEPCQCLLFYEDEPRSHEDMLHDTKDAYECSSEASSALVSLIELDEDDTAKMVKAARTNVHRQHNIMTLPFTEDFLTVKSLKKKQSSDKSDSDYSFLLRPKEDMDNRYARPAWITGLHDPIGLGAFEWEKLVKGILGQGRFGRTSSREPFFRFSLPGNLEILQDITPMTYLENYCFISDRRLALYQKEFGRHRESKGTYIFGSALYKALNGIMVGTLTKDQYKSLSGMLDVVNGSKIESKPFAGVCAVTERLFFSKNLTSSSEESYEIQKGFIEKADFMNINSRLQGIAVSVNINELIHSI